MHCPICRNQMSLRNGDWICNQHGESVIPPRQSDLDWKITALVDDVDEELRNDLQKLLRILRDVGYSEGVLSCMMRCGLRFMSLLYARVGKKVPSDGNLFKCIEDAENKDHILPTEIASYLHLNRVLRNKSSKGCEGITVEEEDAENALTAFLRALKWFYCDGPYPDRLTAIYGDPRPKAETLQAQLHRVEAILRNGSAVPTPRAGLMSESSADLHDHFRGYAADMLGWSRVADVTPYDLELATSQGDSREPLGRVLQSADRLVITGSPGGGKTVFLLRTFRTACERLRDTISRGKVGPDNLTVPLYIELGSFTPTQPFSRLVLERLGVQAEGPPLVAVEQVLKRCSLVLLLDGFNELPEDLREGCVRAIIDLDDQLRARGLLQRLKIALTTRPYGYQKNFERHGYRRVDILPLTLKEIRERFTTQLAPHLRHAGERFDRLGPNLRHLLSNPQHLSYAIEWYRDHAGGEAGGGTAGWSRGSILHHCISKKLEGLEPAFRRAATAALRRIAYEASDGTVHFKVEWVLGQTMKTPLAAAGASSPADVIERILKAGLLVPSGEDRVRFSHHSDLQYFAACEMKERWQLNEYVGLDLWHEPLVILAGLADQTQLEELLTRVLPNQPLYAYVLANVDLPDRVQRFQIQVVDDFTRQARRYARGLGWWLVYPLCFWFASLPPVGYLLMRYGHAEGNPIWISILGSAAALAWVLVPFVVVQWQSRRLAATVERLEREELPHLIATLRYLDSDGALRIVASNLSRYRTELDCLPEDRRAVFLEQAEARVREALVGSYMTDDEILTQMDNPLAAASLLAESLNADQVEYLCQLGGAAGEDASAYNSVGKLKEVYLKVPEHRDRIRQLLIELATGSTVNRRLARLATEACHTLGIPLPRRKSPRARKTLFVLILLFAAAALIAGLWWIFLSGG